MEEPQTWRDLLAEIIQNPHEKQRIALACRSVSSNAWPQPMGILFVVSVSAWDWEHLLGRNRWNAGQDSSAQNHWPGTSSPQTAGRSLRTSTKIMSFQTSCLNTL